MKRYLVGGAVRDHFLKQMGLLPQSSTTDRDWVVVGETVESMIAAGYRQVGASFPVFLHPETNEEHALARRERKTAPGHKGFTFEFGPDVTLEEDLGRRDFTINAIAAEVDEVTGAITQLIDPLCGVRDLASHQLVCINVDTFSDDPLRLYRLAVMTARLPMFEIEIDTMASALYRMVIEEVRSLPPERVYAEACKALCAIHPSRFFWTLAQAGALGIHFAAIDALRNVTDRHVESNAFLHTMLALDAAPPDLNVRWMVLYHDVGKAHTDKALWPRHHGHEDLSPPIARAELEARLRAPRELIDLVTLFARVHMKFHRWRELRASTVLDILESANFSRVGLRWLLLAAEADAEGRLLLAPASPSVRASENHARAAFFHHALVAARVIQGRLFVEKHGEGPKIGNLVHEARVNAIEAIKR